MKKSKELLVAIDAAKAGGKVAMKYYGKLKHVKNKGKNHGIVTEADFASQKKIKAVISKAFADAEFLAEEDSKHLLSETMWVVDPIDGTRNFAKGIPFFAISIALSKKGKTVLGVVFNPATGDLFCGEKGKGAFYNKKKMHVSKVSKLKDAVFEVGLAGRERQDKVNLRVFKKILPLGAVSRQFGAASLELAYVAMGWLDTYIEYGLFPWDTAAGVLFVEESKGIVTNEKGKKFNSLEDKMMVSSNGKIHKQVLREMNR